MKRPASQWYWADWLRAPEIRGISLESRGFWMDLLAIMHAGEPYGHLTIGGRLIDDNTLARMVGATPAKVRKLTAELEAHNVFSRTDLGVIYSRRMVRDEVIRNTRIGAGKLGGNPNLIDPPKDNQDVNPMVNQTDNQKPTPSSSTSSSASPSGNNLTNTARGEFREKLPDDYRPDLEAFLRSIGSEDRQLSWIKSMDAHLTGLRLPHVTADVVGACLRQFVGNGDRPNWRLFEAYLRRESTPREDVPQRNIPRGPADDVKGRGMLIVGGLRAKRTTTVTGHGVRYSIAQSEAESLDPAAKQALLAVGGAYKIANHPDETFSILASQFAAMYAAALSKNSQEKPEETAA